MVKRERPKSVPKSLRPSQKADTSKNLWMGGLRPDRVPEEKKHRRVRKSKDFIEHGRPKDTGRFGA
jgi:hypothetical protein